MFLQITKQKYDNGQIKLDTRSKLPCIRIILATHNSFPL